MSETPRYTGLLLAGGKSSRMRLDKAFLQTLEDGEPLPLFAYLCRRAFPDHPILDGGILISARNDAQVRRMQLPPPAPSSLTGPGIIGALVDDRDKFGDIGPATGMLTAHDRHPDRTFVVLGIDFPRAEAAGLAELIAGHQALHDSPVTLFLHPEDGHPEPCVSVWTPAALGRLRENAAKGKSGPCFTAKQIWRERSPEGLAEGKGLVRPSNSLWVRDTDTPDEWTALFGTAPLTVEVQASSLTALGCSTN